MITSLLSKTDTDHGPVADDLTDWCEHSLSNVNVCKTKEIIKFRKKPPPISAVLIHGQDVEAVQ